MPPANPLTATDWINAALRALRRGGVQAVRAEAIARDLKVSKGSFYWHFKDVKALKEAMLRHWSQHATEDVIGRVDASGDSGAGRLRRLVELATSPGPQDEAAVEQAIRDWSRHEPAAADAVREVDQRRCAYVAALFVATGMGPRDSAVSAELLYGGLIGLGYLGAARITDRRPALMLLLHLLLSSDGDRGDGR